MTTSVQPNIGPRGCRRRSAMGWVWLAFGAAIVAVLATRDAPTSWYYAAFPPFLMGALGLFQARAQTCVFFALTGQRDMDSGAVRITDAAELARIRSQSRRVWIRALLVTWVLMVITFGIATAAR